MKKIHRRDFLKAASGTAAGLCLAATTPGCASKSCNAASGAAAPSSPLEPLKGYKPLVSSAWLSKDEPDGYEQFKAVAESVTDFSWLSPDDSVLVKLSLNSGKKFPAVTDPWSLDCMIRLLKEKGAKSIKVGDSSGVEDVQWTPEKQRGASRELCREAELLQVIEKHGAEPVFFEEKGYDAFFPGAPKGGHDWPSPPMITNAVLEADHIIYLARVSAHAMGGITSGYKIAVGFLREDSRRDFHQGGDKFYAMYEQISRVPEIASRLRLIMSSGRKVLATLGPNDGHISRTDSWPVFASTDLFAHEAFAMAWLAHHQRHVLSRRARTDLVAQITRYRSAINKGFVWLFWRKTNPGPTPKMPYIESDNVYDHPAALSHLASMGGAPEEFRWQNINQPPDSAADFLASAMNSVMA